MTTAANKSNVFSLIVAPCSNCISRHIRCDGRQPSCSACVNACCDCQYKSRANVELGDRERAERINKRIQMLVSNILSLAQADQKKLLENNPAPKHEDLAETVASLDVKEQQPEDNLSLVKKEGGNLPFKLPTGWRLIAQGAGLSMETNIHTLGELYTTLQAIRQEISMEGSPPLGKNLGIPQFRPSKGRMNKSGTMVDRLTFHRQYGYYITSQDSSLNPSTKKSGNNLSRYPQEVLDALMQLHVNCTSQIPIDKQTYLWRYRQGTLPRPLTYAIYACAALHAYRCHAEFDHIDYLEDLADKSYGLARDLVNFDDIRLITIETLMVMQYYRAGTGHIREAYSIFGMAVRMAHTLNLYNLCSDQRASVLEREACRRLWAWMAWFDMSYVIFSGYKPMLCDDKTQLLKMQVLPTDDEAAGDFIESRNLIIRGLQNGVKYALSKDEPDSWDMGLPSPRAMKLLDDLHQWRAALKPNFDVPNRAPTLEGGDGHPKWTTRHRHLYLKHAQYYIFLLTIHKPFVKGLSPQISVDNDDDEEEEGGFSFAKQAHDICTTAAFSLTEIVSIYGYVNDYCMFTQLLDGLSSVGKIHMLNAGILPGTRPVNIKPDVRKRSLEAIERIMHVLSNGPIYKLTHARSMVNQWRTILSGTS